MRARRPLRDGNLGGEIAAEDRARRGIGSRAQRHRNLHDAFGRFGDGDLGAARQRLADGWRELGIALVVLGSAGPVEAASAVRRAAAGSSRATTFSSWATLVARNRAQ